MCIDPLLEVQVGRWWAYSELYLRHKSVDLHPRGHDLAKAIQYMLKRWPAFALFLGDEQWSNRRTDYLLGLIEATPDMTISELLARLLTERDVKASRALLWTFLIAWV